MLHGLKTTKGALCPLFFCATLLPISETPIARRLTRQTSPQGRRAQTEDHCYEQDDLLRPGCISRWLSFFP